MSLSASKPIKVLIAGGSYAGLAAAVNLLDLCLGKPARFATDKEPPLSPVSVEIHIVDERDGYYHLIGSPLAFATSEYAAKCWVRFADIPALQHPNIRISRGSLVKIDSENLIAHIEHSGGAGGSQYSYDFLIAATGLRRVWPVVAQGLTYQDYLTETSEHVQAVKAAVDGVVVIGGGAVGIEMAAELKMVEPALKVTLIHSRDKLLSSEPLPEDTKQSALEALRETGVEVILGQRVTGTTAEMSEDGTRAVQKLTLQNGSHLIASHTMSAISRSVSTTTYLPDEVKDAEGLVKIDSSFRFLGTRPNNARHFAIGDIAAWSGIKRCGAAMAMGHRAADNVHQQILLETQSVSPQLTAWPEVPPMIALAVGKKAVAYDPSGGTRCSEELMQVFFGDDLGFGGCWNHMKLSNGW